MSDKYHLCRFDKLKEIYDEEAGGVYQKIEKTTYRWEPDETLDEYMEWSADPEYRVKVLMTVDSIDDLVDIIEASKDAYNDHYEPDAVLTSQGWRCDV